MSRKRVAIFANGWGNDCLMEIGHGVRQEAALADMDVFAFVDYSVNTEIDEVKKKEFNIFTLSLQPYAMRRQEVIFFF